MRRILADITWPEVGGTPLVLVPVGSIEQHGPHLPLDTDTTIAVAVTTAVADRLDGDVFVAPALAYGSSGEHQNFAGTSSIGTSTLRQVLVELVRSMSTWAERIVFINAHGGNIDALSCGVAQMVVEGHRVGWVACVTEGIDLHAGYDETSIMLHLQPEAVRLECAETGNTQSLSDILPLLRSEGVKTVSPNGVLGDPTGANGAEGAAILCAMVDDIEARILTGSRNEHGILSLKTTMVGS